MIRSVRVLAGLLLIGTVASCMEAPKGKFTSKEGKYSILFPGSTAPKETTSDISAPPPLGNTKQYVASVDFKSDLTFMVIYNDYPDTVTMAAPQKVLGMVRDGSKGATGRILDDGEVADSNPPAREFVIERDGVFYRAHVKLAGTRLYQIVVVGRRQEDVASEGAKKFIQSFELAK